METANLAGRSEPGTLIRGRHHLWSLATGSERKSGGLRRWASGRLNWLNATIWKGIKTPERERRSVGHSGASDWSGFGEGPVDTKEVGQEHLTSKWGLGSEFSLRASERSLQNIGSSQEELADGLWSFDPCYAGKRSRGSEADVVRLS